MGRWVQGREVTFLLVILTLSVNAIVLGEERCEITSCQCAPNTTVLCHNLDIQNWGYVCQQINAFVLKENGDSLKRLQLEKLSDVNESRSLDLDCLPGVEAIKIAFILKEFPFSANFKHAKVFNSIDFSFNELSELPLNVFSEFENLVNLNLSHNSITGLSCDEVFMGLSSLQVLDLSFNNIKKISQSAFKELKNLVYLNLNHNKLNHFSSWHLLQSTSLQTLILSNNLLASLHIVGNESTTASLSRLQSIDISSNPIECSCVLQKVLSFLFENEISIAHSDTTVCNSPPTLKGLNVLQLNDTSLQCSPPHSIVSFPSNEKSVLYRATVKLECHAEAYPSPHILWITPWGEKFSQAPLPLLVDQKLATDNEINLERKYETEAIEITSVIKVTAANDLVISTFRGSFVGNYSCMAFNEVGNRVENIHLRINSSIKSVYVTSLIFASYCASGCLFIGVFMGAIGVLIQRLIKKGFKVPLFTPVTSIRPCSDQGCSIYSDFSPPTSPLLLSSSEKSIPSAGQTLTYDATESPSKRSNYHIRDTLEGARDKLRDGVGRKMESVKRNVQSIKESTGAYVHTIMESGTSAANKMKAGVVMGVETVKYHVQSVKELCGTGNMGGHTVSIVSMETDIDTNERKSIVRQVTLV